MIYIIGIGPGGSVDYLTQRAREIAQTLDTAIYVGEMISPEVLAFFGKDKVKHGRLPEADVLNHIRKAVLDGRNLAVLVPGDPCLYSGQQGRERSVGDYIAWLRMQGVDFEVVPGVSSWMALCAICAIDMTAFSGSQAVFVVSLERMLGQSSIGNLELAKLDAVFSMRPSLALFQSYAFRRELVPALRRYYPESTRIVIGYKVSWPDQRILKMGLADLDLVALGDDFSKHSIILLLSENN